MEVKIYFSNGSIELHRIPELVGVNSSVYIESAKKEEGVNSLDDVADIVERFFQTDRGFFLERYTVAGTPNREKVYANGTRDNCILPVSKLGTVKLILADDEQVYPNVDPIDKSDIERALSSL